MSTVHEIFTRDPLVRGTEKSFQDHEISIRDVIARTHLYRFFEQIERQKSPGWLERLKAEHSIPPRAIKKIGIIGAGAAGLYAAMILEDLGIPYEILEANSRLGGRLFTYRFNGEDGKKAPVNDPARYDYFDVGGMRFPCIPWMGRVFDLFDRMKMNDLLIDYKYSDDKNHMYFNGYHTLVQNATVAGDPFHVSVENGGNIPNNYANIKDAVDHWTGNIYDEFKDKFADVYKLPEAERPAAFREAWAALTAHDYQSTRAYMHSVGNYPDWVINWLETFDSATGLYDEDFVESVIDSLDFGWPNPQTHSKPWKQHEGESDGWKCIDGGSDRIIDAMIASLAIGPDQPNQLLTGERITRIAETDDPDEPMLVESTSQAGSQQFRYSQVICTAPLGCVAPMDLTDANLLYGHKIAIRSLHYDTSAKVGLKFATRWWEDPKFVGEGQQFRGGTSQTDLPIRSCVYPSYGFNVPPETPPTGVMIASYTWAQDAQRIGSLCQNSDPQADSLLLEMVLNNIADLHGLSREKLPPCLDHYAFNWYQNPYSRGAFALFGPGQFGSWPADDEGKGGYEPSSQAPSSMFASMKAPAANGKLHFAGEATSIHHAWVLGALNSAWRAVYNALDGYPELQSKLVANWGIPDEETEISLKLLQAAREDGML